MDMKLALENLRSITEVSVTKYQMGPFGYQWTIVWSQAYGDQPSMTLDFSKLVGTAPTMDITESGTEQTVDGTLPPDYGSYVMSRQNDQNSRCGGTLDSNQQGVCSEGVHQIQTILSEANSLLKFSRQRSWFWNISWFGWFGFGCCWCIGTRIFNQIVDDI